MTESNPGEMATVSVVLEKLRLKKRDKEFRMTPEGFTAGTGKFYKPEDLKIIRYLNKYHTKIIQIPPKIFSKGGN